MCTESGDIPLVSHRWFVDRRLERNDSQTRIRVKDYDAVVAKLVAKYDGDCKIETIVREPGHASNRHKGNPFDPNTTERRYFIDGSFVVLDLKSDYNSSRAVRVYHDTKVDVGCLAAKLGLHF